MKAIVLLFLLSVSLNYLLCDDSDLALNRQRVALLRNQTEDQLQATIQSNLAFAQPLVQNRNNSYSSSGLTILADYTNRQIVFWNKALNDLEARVNQTTDPGKRLEMLRAFAVNTESMRWDETERNKYPAITPANITITRCRPLNVINLRLKLNVNLAELSGILTLAAAQQTFLMDEYLAQLYTELLVFYSRIYREEIRKASALNGINKCKNLTALYRELSRLIYVMTTSAKA